MELIPDDGGIRTLDLRDMSRMIYHCAATAQSLATKTLWPSQPITFSMGPYSIWQLINSGNQDVHLKRSADVNLPTLAK
jgi:hypothetical protein